MDPQFIILNLDFMELDTITKSLFKVSSLFIKCLLIYIDSEMN